MKIGVLLTDDVRDSLQPEFGRYAAMFRALLDPPTPPDGAGGADGEGFAYEVYDAREGEAPDSPDACGAYVVTGSRHGVHDGLAWQAKFFRLLRDLHSAERPMAGVCFGHQALAHALGGEVHRAPGGWLLGLQEWPVLRRESWMVPPLAKLRLLCSCQDQVKVPPPGSVVLAGSGSCPVAAFAAGRTFAVQGHPEFTPAFSRALMEFRRGEVDDAVLSERAQSADGENDSATCAKWMRELFRTEGN